METRISDAAPAASRGYRPSPGCTVIITVIVCVLISTYATILLAPHILGDDDLDESSMHVGVHWDMSVRIGEDDDAQTDEPTVTTTTDTITSDTTTPDTTEQAQSNEDDVTNLEVDLSKDFGVSPRDDVTVVDDFDRAPGRDGSNDTGNDRAETRQPLKKDAANESVRPTVPPLRDLNLQCHADPLPFLHKPSRFCTGDENHHEGAWPARDVTINWTGSPYVHQSPRSETVFTWGEWSAWTQCSVTCGAGMRIRVRKCLHADFPSQTAPPDVCGVHRVMDEMEEACHKRHCSDDQAEKPNTFSDAETCGEGAGSEATEGAPGDAGADDGGGGADDGGGGDYDDGGNQHQSEEGQGHREQCGGDEGDAHDGGDAGQDEGQGHQEADDTHQERIDDGDDAGRDDGGQGRDADGDGQADDVDADADADAADNDAAQQDADDVDDNGEGQNEDDAKAADDDIDDDGDADDDNNDANDDDEGKNDDDGDGEDDEDEQKKKQQEEEEEMETDDMEEEEENQKKKKRRKKKKKKKRKKKKVPTATLR